MGDRDFMKISEILKQAAQILESNGVNESRREAGSLLALALGKDKIFLIAHSEYELSGAEEDLFRNFVDRRARREPLQYIRGTQEFYGLDFIVTKEVLIPRPETEMIVEKAVEILKTLENSHFCEIGIGSGCLSVSILHEVKTALATGLDISEKALEIARLNARKNDVSERLELKNSDVFEQIKPQKFDLIVSNPPYVSSADFAELQAEVRDFEPRIAVTDGGNGLSIIEKIVSESPQFIKKGGFLLMEIGFGQVEDVKNLFDEKLWQTVEILPDLQNIPRMIRARTL